MVTDGNSQVDNATQFFRLVRAGNLDKVLEYLDGGININVSNANGLNALHLAAKDGHVEIMKELLKRGAQVDAATNKGNTALHIASLAGQTEIVNILIQAGASINIQSQNGFTPLYMAAQENHDQVVTLLLHNRANQSLATEDGFTPLAVAMQQGHEKVVSVLLENDSKGKVRLPALHIAAKKDDCKAADLLLQKDNLPDVVSKSGFTPLHIAAHYGNEDIARLLISRGADVNYLAKHSICPLHVAAKWGKNNLVKILLDNSAMKDAKTRDGLTPLHCAARSGHEKVVSTLLENGAPISARTKNGLAPLHMASQGDHVDVARILLYHGAPVDEVTIDYLTSLHVAAHCGHVRVAKLLLDRKADPNARALNGFTPLHIACKKNRIKVVELLLKNGASIQSTTKSGLTPLHVASFMGCMNIVIFLLQHEANPDMPTMRGETPLHLAARSNQTDIIRILLRNGAKVDARAREQQTPLHIAARLGNVDIVLLLLQHGADIDRTTKGMYTALHIAAKEGQEEVATILVDNNASVSATTKNGYTPLHIAAKYGNTNVAGILLQKDVNLEAQAKNDLTPLHLACHYDHLNMAQLLLEKGASPNHASQNGHTPLHIAARKNQMDIAWTLLENGANVNMESKAGFTPLHLSAQKGHYDMSNMLIEHGADTNHQAKNGLTAVHLCAQEDFTRVAAILVKNGASVSSETRMGYRPIHIAAHFGNLSMINFLLDHKAEIDVQTTQNYTPLHQAAQQGHAHVVSALIEKNASHGARTNDGLTALNIAEKLGYISVMEVLKGLPVDGLGSVYKDNKYSEDKYKVVAPETLQESYLLSDSDEEGGSDDLINVQPYRYLTADLMKGLRDDSLPVDVTRDDPNYKQVPTDTYGDKEDFMQSTNYCCAENFENHVNTGYRFLVSFLVDARGGTMKSTRHSGIRLFVPPQKAMMPIRITCRMMKLSKIAKPPPLMEGEALATRIIEMGPVGTTFLGPILIDIPHYASVRGKEREIVIFRSDNGETWKEHDNPITSDDIETLTPFDPEMRTMYSTRIARVVTSEFPQYFAIVTRIKQEVQVIGNEGGILISSVANNVQAVFPPGALTKKIKVGLQAHVIPAELTTKILGNSVAVSPVITIEPRRRKFHKPITLMLPVPQPVNKGMVNQSETPSLRLLCSISGGTSEAQWEDVTGSTPFKFVSNKVTFTTTVSARFWLLDCRTIHEVPKMATELYKESIYVPFITNFVIYSKRLDIREAILRILCLTDSKEGLHTLEKKEKFTEIAKSRDVEALDCKDLYIEFSGNLVPITKSGQQLKLKFQASRQNRLSFHLMIKDPMLDPVARMLFMREPKVAKDEPSQRPICILNVVLSEIIDNKHTEAVRRKSSIRLQHQNAISIKDSLERDNTKSEFSDERLVSETDLDSLTYSEKRQFWEDITSKNKSRQLPSETSQESQLSFYSEDSDTTSIPSKSIKKAEISKEDDEKSEEKVPEVAETLDVSKDADISEFTVAEKASYFEEQIQKDIPIMRPVPKARASQIPKLETKKHALAFDVSSKKKTNDENNKIEKTIGVADSPIKEESKMPDKVVIKTGIEKRDTIKRQDAKDKEDRKVSKSATKSKIPGPQDTKDSKPKSEKTVDNIFVKEVQNRKQVGKKIADEIVHKIGPQEKEHLKSEETKKLLMTDIDNKMKEDLVEEGAILKTERGLQEEEIEKQSTSFETRHKDLPLLKIDREIPSEGYIMKFTNKFELPLILESITNKTVAEYVLKHSGSSQQRDSNKFVSQKIKVAVSMDVLKKYFDSSSTPRIFAIPPLPSQDTCEVIFEILPQAQKGKFSDICLTLKPGSTILTTSDIVENRDIIILSSSAVDAQRLETEIDDKKHAIPCDFRDNSFDTAIPSAGRPSDDISGNIECTLSSSIDTKKVKPKSDSFIQKQGADNRILTDIPSPKTVSSFKEPDFLRDSEEVVHKRVSPTIHTQKMPKHDLSKKRYYDEVDVEKILKVESDEEESGETTIDDELKDLGGFDYDENLKSESKDYIEPQEHQQQQPSNLPKLGKSDMNLDSVKTPVASPRMSVKGIRHKIHKEPAQLLYSQDEVNIPATKVEEVSKIVPIEDEGEENQEITKEVEEICVKKATYVCTDFTTESHDDIKGKMFSNVPIQAADIEKLHTRGPVINTVQDILYETNTSHLEGVCFEEVTEQTFTSSIKPTAIVEERETKEKFEHHDAQDTDKSEKSLAERKVIMEFEHQIVKDTADLDELSGNILPSVETSVTIDETEDLKSDDISTEEMRELPSLVEQADMLPGLMAEGSLEIGNVCDEPLDNLKECVDILNAQAKPGMDDLTENDITYSASDSQVSIQHESHDLATMHDSNLDIRQEIMEHDDIDNNRNKEKSSLPQVSSSPLRTIRDDVKNIDLTSQNEITALKQEVKKEIAEVQENLEAAKKDLIEELSETNEAVLLVKDSPSEFQFKLPAEFIPNNISLIEGVQTMETFIEVDNYSSGHPSVELEKYELCQESERSPSKTAPDTNQDLVKAKTSFDKTNICDESMKVNDLIEETDFLEKADDISLKTSTSADSKKFENVLEKEDISKKEKMEGKEIEPTIQKTNISDQTMEFKSTIHEPFITDYSGGFLKMSITRSTEDSKEFKTTPGILELDVDSKPIERIPDKIDIVEVSKGIENISELNYQLEEFDKISEKESILSEGIKLKTAFEVNVPDDSKMASVSETFNVLDDSKAFESKFGKTESLNKANEFGKMSETDNIKDGFKEQESLLEDTGVHDMKKQEDFTEKADILDTHETGELGNMKSLEDSKEVEKISETNNIVDEFTEPQSLLQKTDLYHMTEQEGTRDKADALDVDESQEVEHILERADLLDTDDSKESDRELFDSPKLSVTSPIPSIRISSGADEIIDPDVVKPFMRPTRKRKTPSKRHHDRVKSEADLDVSSSGESNYQSFEYDIGSGSRPSSMDVDGLQSTGPTSTTLSEYETAQMSIGHHSSSRPTSQEYETAAGSSSSRDSMKSLNSWSSGHLGSVDSPSEHSETLVVSDAEMDADEINLNLENVLEHDREEIQDDSEDIVKCEDAEIPYGMKRSTEMYFNEGDLETPTEEQNVQLKFVDSTTITVGDHSETIVESVDIMTSRVEVDNVPNASTQIFSKHVTDETKPSCSSEPKASKSDTNVLTPDSLDTQPSSPPDKMPENEDQEEYKPSSISCLPTTSDDKEAFGRNSPDSDSFELVDKPDLMDEFVVVEEVGREAEEFDSEGKAIHISAFTYSNVHDSDVEKLLGNKEEATDHQLPRSNDLFQFDPEESHLQASGDDQYSHYYGDGEQAEGSKKWIEMQFQSDVRPFDIEYDRGPLEDIKEEEVADFEAGSSRIGSLGSQKESVGSIGSIRGSCGSTPDAYDLLGRKHFKSSEHDNLSLSSLQEFEHLENVVQETKKPSCGSSSQDSSSNGSLPRKYATSISSTHGDDISLSSLKDFESMEKACREAHLMELKAREEAELLDHESPENKFKLENLERIKQEAVFSARAFSQKVSGVSDDCNKRATEIEEIIRIAQTNFERLDSLEDDAKDIAVAESSDAASSVVPVVEVDESNIMATSIDSLELEENSIGKPTSFNHPSNSSDSLNNLRDAAEAQGSRDERQEFRSRISTDSLEFSLVDSQDDEHKEQKSTGYK